jgi:hypothetical protein
MKFIIGDRKEGYSYSHAPLTNPKEPWTTSVWLDNTVRRHDSFKTATQAINYAHDRNTGGRRYKSPLKVHIRRR